MAADPNDNNTQNAKIEEDDDTLFTEEEEEEEAEEEEEEEEDEEEDESGSDLEESPNTELDYYRRRDSPELDLEEEDESTNNPQSNIQRFSRVLDSKRLKKEQEEAENNYVYHEDRFNFPKDPENWREEHLKELWGDAPIEMTKPGWDPNWVSDDEMEIVEKEIEAGNDPPIAPFYVPYRKPYPVIPDNNYDVSNPKAVIEELDRIEEFLTWVSYIFEDGSS